MGLYRELATLRDQGRFDPSMITVCQLDEYLGIGLDDRRTLFGWMQRTFLAPLRIADERVVRLPVSGDLEAACATYDRELEGRGGVDLAILGIGANGHLGFNEPPSDRSAPTRRVQLSRSSDRGERPVLGLARRRASQRGDDGHGAAAGRSFDPAARVRERASGRSSPGRCRARSAPTCRRRTFKRLMT